VNKTGYDTGGYPAIGDPRESREPGTPRYSEDRYNDPYPSGSYAALPEEDPYDSPSSLTTHQDLQHYRRSQAAIPADPQPVNDPYPPDDRSSIVDPLDCIDEISALVEAARAVPMSSNCMVNRHDLLGMLDELRASLPGEIRKAETLLAERDSVIAVGQREAERIIAEGEHEHRRLVSIAEVTVSAEHEASRIIAEARAEAQNLRDEIEEYVDTTLANFEQMLQRTMATVERGRDKMRALSEIGSFDGQQEEKPLPF
jgi:F0F1-type ATP synthase membrane subunit b/b'